MKHQTTDVRVVQALRKCWCSCCKGEIPKGIHLVKIVELGNNWRSNLCAGCLYVLFNEAYKLNNPT